MFTVLGCQVCVQPPRWFPRKEKKNFLASVGRCCFLTGCNQHTAHLITARPESIFNGRLKRKGDREGGQRRGGRQRERKGDAVAAECSQSTKWWRWRTHCSTLHLPLKASFISFYWVTHQRIPVCFVSVWVGAVCVWSKCKLKCVEMAEYWLRGCVCVTERERWKGRHDVHYVATVVSSVVMLLLLVTNTTIMREYR